MSAQPPSLRRQDWATILTMATLTFVIITTALLYFTWSLGTNWPSLSKHLSYWGNALIDLLLHRSLNAWQHYWALLTKHQLTYHFAAHTIVPAFIAFILQNKEFY